MDQIEKYIMTRLYKYVFCPETTDDEKKDRSIWHPAMCKCAYSVAKMGLQAGCLRTQKAP